MPRPRLPNGAAKRREQTYVDPGVSRVVDYIVAQTGETRSLVVARMLKTGAKLTLQEMLAEQQEKEAKA